MSGGESETGSTTIKYQRPELVDFIVSNINLPVQVHKEQLPALRWPGWTAAVRTSGNENRSQGSCPGPQGWYLLREQLWGLKGLIHDLSLAQHTLVPGFKSWLYPLTGQSLQPSLCLMVNGNENSPTLYGFCELMHFKCLEQCLTYRDTSEVWVVIIIISMAMTAICALCLSLLVCTNQS